MVNSVWDLCVLESLRTALTAPADADNSGESPIRHLTAGAAALNEFAASAKREWLAFVADSNVDLLRKHADQITSVIAEHSQRNVVLIPLGESLRNEQENSTGAAVGLPKSIAGLAAIWQRFSPQLAALVARPELQGAVFLRRYANSTAGLFRDLYAPLWDRVLELSRGEGSAAVLNGPWCEPGTESIPLRLEDLPELAPKSPGPEKRWLKEHLRRFEIPATNSRSRSRPEAIALKAGLYQIHDFLNESHVESQSIEGEGQDQTGDYWHGIMHRREPDPSNAKYWFRHVGRHPVFLPLAESAVPIFSAAGAGHWGEKICGKRGWEPFAFIDFSEECRTAKNHPLEAVARGIQWIEMLLLLGHTYDSAV